MPLTSETLVDCHSCGSPMDVSPLPPFTNVACPACGQHTRVKLTFGQYTLVRRHALGGMSRVFVAYDSISQCEVAVKILNESYSGDEQRIKAFEQEARLASLFSHPNVVRVLTTGTAFGHFYIAMEFIPGGHFEHQIRERGKIPEVEMLPLAIEIAQGLKATHAAGLIHRDVKPGNILIDADGHAKLVDFGLALVTHGGVAQATELWATPYYVPPETIEGFPEDFRSDIYAFGATLYHALAGKPSCGDESISSDLLRLQKQVVKPLGELEPSLSVATCRIVNRAMAYDPKKRFASYDDLIAALENALKRLESGNGVTVEGAERAAQQLIRQRRRNRVGFTVVSLVVCGLGVWGISRQILKKWDLIEKSWSFRSAALRPESYSSADVAKNYGDARAAVAAHEFPKATARLMRLFENPAVQEPTRSWAGVEAVAVSYLAGQDRQTVRLATESVSHARMIATGSSRIGEPLLLMLDRVSQSSVILPPEKFDVAAPDAAQVMSWMLAGLKDWQLGKWPEAGKFFAAVTAAPVLPEQPWLQLYQNLARDHLADALLLSRRAMDSLPTTVAECQTAIAELDAVLPALKTHGSAQFVVSKYQRDLVHQAKKLAAAALPSSEPELPTPEVAPPVESTPDAMLAKLGEFAVGCHFDDATGYLLSLPPDSLGVSLDALLALTHASTDFITDLETDLRLKAAKGEFQLKSGESIRQIAIDSDGDLKGADAKGQTQVLKWADLTPDALIELHRALVKNGKDDAEQVRRNECAIAYAWLVGNRARALSAAAALAKTHPDFKTRWGLIAKDLPK